MKLLVIRPQPGADASAARIKGAGHEPLLMPLFAVEAVAWNAPGADYDGLLLTSANAVRQAGPKLEALAHLPVLAVGKVTAVAAEKAGLNVTVSGNSNAEDLLSGVAESKLLWLAGEDYTALAVPPSVRIDLRIVYRSASLPVPAGFDDLVLQADHVLLHSARAAQHFASLILAQELEKAAVSIAALSAGVARAAGDGWKSVHVAPEPNDAALLSLL
jgi:uroporphyrinogen-III synthase